MELIVKIKKQWKGFDLDINMECQEESLGFLGPSGCGKTMTLKCIAGIETPDSGIIQLNGRTLFDSKRGINLPVQQRNVGMMFQNHALFPHMTVRKNIEIGIRNKKEKKELIADRIRMFRLEGMLSKYPHQLSGGEQQRVALARSLVLEPELLMLDEPFYALDYYLKDQLQQELMEMLRSYQGMLIMVSHSRDEIYRFCKTIAVVKDGHILEHGSRLDVFEKPQHLTAARLTGCSNISRAEKISDYSVRAVDWNLLLSTKCYVDDAICYIGIRPDRIKAGQGNEKENLLPVITEDSTYEAFVYTLHMKSKLGREDCPILWTIPKTQENRHLKPEEMKHILLPKEELLLLKEDPVIESA